jgi:hypothetical protein
MAQYWKLKMYRMKNKNERIETTFEITYKDRAGLIKNNCVVLAKTEKGAIRQFNYL